MNIDELMNVSLPWYRRLFPWLPIIHNNKELRCLKFIAYKHATRIHPISKKHFFDLIKPLHKNRWIPVCGFQIWY